MNARNIGAQEVTLSALIQKKVAGAVQSVGDTQGLIHNLNYTTTDLLELLLAIALTLSASDIHLEPEEEDVVLRMRVDGILHSAGRLSKDTYKSLRDRIKLKSSLKFNVTARPQDGRFEVTKNGKEMVEVRTSSLPSEYGESLVMRILDPKSLVSIERLGLREDLLTLCKEELRKPNGMLITTGPTGSGKTTTLYAFLRHITRPEIKIITIEDPIEYHIEGISQTQTRPEKEYTFASGLQAIVRQDPDAILVGEIRDKETARIALQASLTGHLVFTTLHTNDAAGTVSRLTSLGANVANIAPALSLIIAQRLVRVLCALCARKEPATKEEQEIIKKAVANIPKNLRPSLPRRLVLTQPKGCDQCNKTGYKGRTGIFEVIHVTEELEEYILQTPSISGLRKKARARGMVPMYQDGILKVLQGVTSIQEVLRVSEPAD